jgi:hypothetical protein
MRDARTTSVAGINHHADELAAVAVAYGYPAGKLP